MTKEKAPFDLSKYVEGPKGVFTPIKKSTQPRDKAMGKSVSDIIETQNLGSSYPKTYLFTGTSQGSTEDVRIDGEWSYNPILRKVSLTLFGEPMPKQSVRSYASGRKNAKGILIVDHFQPKEMGVRTADYQRQIREQLPADFKMFESRVHVTKMHFVFSPLKSFQKIKGRMDDIRSGKIIWKETKPDLPDNLKKLVNDSMSGLVFKDDNIIVSEDNVKKYYGIGGCIIIELTGY